MYLKATLVRVTIFVVVALSVAFVHVRVLPVIVLRVMLNLIQTSSQPQMSQSGLYFSYVSTHKNIR